MSILSNSPPSSQPLPVSWEECRARGWTGLDILLITGDGYVDHPSFGVALIGRLLQSHGYKVAILPQPRVDNNRDFQKFPSPHLFCGITAGCLDSIVANYSSNGKVRNRDDYSPGGNPWRGDERLKADRLRPDRATLVYTSLARSSFKGVPIILGGIEASLRRFVHYDYKQDKLRGSFLTDAKADILVYGMGEKAVLQIAKRLKEGDSLDGINGTCQRLTEKELQDRYPRIELKNSRKVTILPSLVDITGEKKLFLQAEIETDRNLRAYSPRLILQKQQSHWVLQHPAQAPLTPEELDSLYDLPFSKRPHPAKQEIPAHRMIEHSVTIVRGCSGNCSFCAITRHQGPAIISRSRKSIVRECRRMVKMDSFRGTISDLGGPTANLYGTKCSIGSCKKHDCLYPKTCPNLHIDENRFLKLLEEVSAIKGVNHLFISSGLRMELLLNTPKLMKKIIRHHTPGALKIAPEHSEEDILALMHKEPHQLLQKFVKQCREITRQSGKKVLLTPYIITSHPGSTVDHTRNLAGKMKALGLQIRKFQDFTPTPGTISTAMYVTGLEPDSGKPLFIPRNQSERNSQRQIIEREFHLGKTKKGR
ncbi:MAG: YgiQ family radical SAM protein [Deltaproteobacteria bacterium]|nr:YgiQ family radical SAM protein [Deltaproteobacteria bacterium]